MKDRYDYLVIGSGPAGHVSAIKAAQLGLKVAVVEKDAEMFGGVCLNEGCIPAKSLYNSARIFDLLRMGPELCGLEAQCGGVDMARLVKKSRDAALQLRKGLSFLFKKNGIDLVKGMARFIDSGTVRVSGEAGEPFSVKAKNYLIATGSTPKALPGIDLDGKNVITSSRAIRLEKVPEKALIVGGGAIGAEFASFFDLIGAEVAIVEIEDALLPGEDREVSKCLESVFKRKGMTVHTSSRVTKASVKGDRVTVKIKGGKGEQAGDYNVVLVSVGRVPATSGIGLEEAGIEADGGGFIRVDPGMRTNVKNIYAAGDVLRTPMLAHVASAEGEAAAEAVSGNKPEPVDYSAVPNAVYTQVQVASVGVTEEAAKREGLDFSAGKQFFKAGGKAVVNSQPEGFIKVIADNRTHRLLGAHIIGHEAAELIHEFIVAKTAGLKVEDIARSVHAHPTFSETAVDACRAVFGRPVYG
ncbi:MAG: dihydrolipoyl dehydrogenase [Candidatus Omnitrophota bacterium]|nr:dihydrolipoyl dehydrogenase [Candidatus Omnitrophota bacterium]